MTALLLQALGAFGAGIAASLSPCVYPMVPITVGYLGSAGEQGRKTRVLGFFFGQVATFVFLGLIAVSLGEVLGFSSEIPAVQVATGALLLALAYFSFQERLPVVLARLNRFQGKGDAGSLFGAVLVGASSAAVASPCTSPILGGVLATVSQVEERIWGLALMASFALGLSFLFLLIGLGLARAHALPRAGLWMRHVQKASSVLLALGGTYFVARGFGFSFF